MISLLTLQGAHEPASAPPFAYHSGQNEGYISLGLIDITNGDGAVVIINTTPPGDNMLIPMTCAIAGAYGWKNLPSGS